MGPTTKRLIRRLESECDLAVPKDVELLRVRAGYWQRAAGAWSWVLRSYATNWQLASSIPVGELVRQPKLQVGRNRHGDLEVE